MVYSCKIVKSESVRCSVWLFETPWTVASQAPLFVEFSRQEYWSSHWLGSHSLQGNLPDPGIKPRSPTLQADSTPSEPSGKPIIVKKAHHLLSTFIIYWAHLSFICLAHSILLLLVFNTYENSGSEILNNSIHTSAAKSLQSCLTLCNLMDCSPPGSSIRGILQARILE